MPGFLSFASMALLPVLARTRGSGGSFSYSFSLGVQPILALIAGVLILIRPRLLNFIVAVYLIIVGITGLVQVSF